MTPVSVYRSVVNLTLTKEASTYSRWELTERPTTGHCVESERLGSTHS